MYVKGEQTPIKPSNDTIMSRMTNVNSNSVVLELRLVITPSYCQKYKFEIDKFVSLPTSKENTFWESYFERIQIKQFSNLELNTVTIIMQVTVISLKKTNEDNSIIK